MSNNYSNFIYDYNLKKKYFHDIDPIAEKKYDIVFISSMAEGFRLDEFQETIKNIKSADIEKAGLTEDGSYYYLFCRKVGDPIAVSEDFEEYEIGFTIGSDLRKYHDATSLADTSSWTKEYETKINQIFHEYGIQDYHGANDYIILDLLTQTKNLLKDRDNIKHLIYENLDDIEVGENGQYNLIKHASFSNSDPFYVFHNINKTGVKNGAYAAGLIDGYFKGDTPNLFFKYLVMYTLTDAFYEIIADKKSLPEEAFKKTMEELKVYYDDFSEIKPKWYLSCRKNLMQ